MRLSKKITSDYDEYGYHIESIVRIVVPPIMIPDYIFLNLAMWLKNDRYNPF